MCYLVHIKDKFVVIHTMSNGTAIQTTFKINIILKYVLHTTKFISMSQCTDRNAITHSVN